jgi:hypothetical protein
MIEIRKMLAWGDFNCIIGLQEIVGDKIRLGQKNRTNTEYQTILNWTFGIF